MQYRRLLESKKNINLNDLYRTLKISAILLAEFFDIRPGLLCPAARRSGSGIGGTVAIIQVQRY